MPAPSPLSLLQTTKAPWVSLLVTESGQKADSLLHAPGGFLVKVIRGSACKTASDLFREFARALEFPDYFGHNWDALEECLADLEWLPAKGYVLLLTEADRVLSGNEEDWATFVEVLNDAGEAWGSGQAAMGSRRATPFHVICDVSRTRKSARAHWGLTELSTEGTGKPRAKRQASRSRNKRGR